MNDSRLSESVLQSHLLYMKLVHNQILNIVQYLRTKRCNLIAHKNDIEKETNYILIVYL